MVRQGGAIYVAEQLQLLVTKCVFEDNSAQNDAGAILAILNVTLNIRETTFVGNKAIEGGTINSQRQVHLQIINCVFKDNSAQVVAGAIVAAFNVTLNIQGTTFLGNKAWQPGAIQVEQQVHLRITNCTFENNSAQNIAGAIGAADNVTLDIQRTTFVGNKALAHDGGAIGASHNATLILRETSFIDNKASLVGGAITVHTASYLAITNCAFEDNSSQQMGGGIIGYNNSTLDIRGTRFTRNRAEWGGGIDTNTNVYLRVTDCTFVDNHAEETGGAIAADCDAVFQIQGTNFTRNSASQGGAIDVPMQVNITKCRLDRNSASDFGGALLVSGNATLEIRETNFTGNSASRAGGALGVLQSQCHVVRSVFHSNTAIATGGAMSIESPSLLQIENTNFTKNNSSNGGAIDIDANSKLQANVCSFWDNHANKAVGAIGLEYKSTVVIESCHFLSNHALNGAGGGVILNNPEYASLRDTFFLRNVASDRGGAIAIGGGTVLIDNITCVGNRDVSGTGGGCLSTEHVTLTLTNSEISENIDEHEFGGGLSDAYSRIQVGYHDYLY